MTRLTSVIVTDITPDDVTITVAPERQRAALDLGGGVYMYPAERGTLDGQLRQIASIGAEIMGQAINRLEDQSEALFPETLPEPVRFAPTEDDEPETVAIHLPVTHVSEGDVDTWTAAVDATPSGCPVLITCDGDRFDAWGEPATIGDTLHVVATCKATFSEVARVAAYVGEMVGLDGDPEVTHATDWNRPATLTTKAVA